jgi:tRNA-2-methylthio-N6-dimethylallyladenosine synthase
MRRGYTSAQYIDLIQRIRNRVPEVVLSNDIIVGFPGETHAQFKRTYHLLQEFEFDTVHVATYSPRPGTIAWRKMEDDVPHEEKQRRMKLIEELQERISLKHNSFYLGKNVEILVEGQRNGKWYGRTRGDKPVFYESDHDYQGELIEIRIDHTGPWSLNGTPMITARLK